MDTGISHFRKKEVFVQNENIHWERSVLAGFLGTLVMTILFYIAPVMGLPRVDVAAMIGSWFQHGIAPATVSGLWWAGMILHFVAGSFIFSLLYAYLLMPRVHGNAWAKGGSWGLVLWLIGELTIMPAEGRGLFAFKAAHHWALLSISVLAFLLYGALLGGFAESRARSH